MKIKELPSNIRPRERLKEYGSKVLSDEEILSIILKTGYKGYNVKTLSNNLLKEVGSLDKLKDITLTRLKTIKGIGEVKAIELLASLELGKRVYYNKPKDKIKLNNTDTIYNYFKDIFINEKQECFYALYLDTQIQLISYKLLFKGTLSSSCVHPRDIFRNAILENAHSIIVIHNHPSGDITPSKEDDITTQSLSKIGKLMGIPLLDHLIFGDTSYYSYYKSQNI